MPRKSPRIPLDVRGLIGDEDLFRIASGVRRDPAIQQWLNEEPVELRSIAKLWFEQMRSAGSDIRELIHDGCPVACVEDAPFGYVNTFKSHVNVGFFNGAALKDPNGLLQGSGKRMRHVKLQPGGEVNTKALRQLIDAAYADIKARLAAKQ
jgi:hypothetical protein